MLSVRGRCSHTTHPSAPAARPTLPGSGHGRSQALTDYQSLTKGTFSLQALETLVVQVTYLAARVGLSPEAYAHTARQSAQANPTAQVAVLWLLLG